MQMLSMPTSLFENHAIDNKMRFLFYCHDTYGLGHIRRALSLAAYFTETMPNAEVLIVTGSPFAHSFALPPRVDYVKLPAVTKTNTGAYHARSFDLDFSAIRDLRASILRETARGFRPDVFLVDHAPQGLKGEALSTLAMLKYTQPECLRVLGLRDIVDSRDVIQKTWNKEGIYQTLEQDYDLILVYGSRGLYDVAQEYNLPASVDRRVRYCGYLDRVANMEVTPTSSSRPLVVLTAGGGGDGFPIMRDYLIGLRQLTDIPFDSVLLTGPLMDDAEQSELRGLTAFLPADKIRIESFMPDPLPLLRSADLVVAMAGYNTTCELLALKQRMLLVPRIIPRKEQLIRASILSQHGLAQMLSPEDMTPESLIASVQRALLQPRPTADQLAETGISFDGQASARDAILEAMELRNAQPWAIQRLVENVA